jgi:hypothetical protein
MIENPTFGAWLPIEQYSKIYWPEVKCQQVLFFHPKYCNSKGQEFISGIQFINWPEIPNTHFYILPLCLPEINKKEETK